MSVVDSLVEVSLLEQEDFLKIKETLTRIGVASKKVNIVILSFVPEGFRLPHVSIIQCFLQQVHFICAFFETFLDFFLRAIC